jgi:DHA1 family bicyclomycin/chloramphenicol resistance-like MFS transporter
VFPILTLALLDMYPRQRGGASSAQAFIGLVLNAVVAGVLSPLVSHNGMRLALTAAGFTGVAWWLWRGYARHHPVVVQVPQEVAMLEPADEM